MQGARLTRREEQAYREYSSDERLVFSFMIFQSEPDAANRMGKRKLRPDMKGYLVVNGFDNSYMREFGCACARCQMPRRRANTSLSLILRSPESDETLFHALFDCGAGVVDSLCENPFLQGRNARLDQIFLTHWHSDHTSGLERVLKTFRRSRERLGEKPDPVNVWCRLNSGRRLGLRYAGELHDGIIVNSGEKNAPGTALPKIELDYGVKVRPITVSHMSADMDSDGNYAFACASYVVEIGKQKAVLLWDLDNTNTWICDPKTPRQRESASLMSDADYLFIDCNCFDAEEFKGENTNHIAFRSVREYARTLSPRQTILMHISGHEDEGLPGWGWDDETWQREVKMIWIRDNLPGEVIVPQIGRHYPIR